MEIIPAPLIFGNIGTTADEVAAMSLPPKFTTYAAIEVAEIEVAAEVMAAKVKWELRARENRNGDTTVQSQNQDRGGAWTEDWELEQVREKEVYQNETATIDFANQRVTDVASCRRIIPPQTLPSNQSVILNNMVSRIKECTRKFVTEKCNKSGQLREQNMTIEENKGI